MRGYLAVVLLAALVAGCTKTEVVDAPTQVMLRITTRDPQLLDELDTLELAIRLREGDNWKAPALRSFPEKGLNWPVDIPITPRVRADAYKQFEIVVEARKDDAVLAQARVISGFLPEQRRLLELELFGCPGKPGFVCATEACVGEECEACTLDGTCAPVESVDPNDLKPWKGGTATPPVVEPIVPSPEDDSGVDAGDLMDATKPVTDAQSTLDTTIPTEDGSRADSTVVDAAQQEFALGTAGTACAAAHEGTLACAGHASASVLRCRQGMWQSERTCATSERCDSRAGAEQGTCRVIPAACVDKAPGPICDGKSRLECGVDLVTISPLPCAENTHCAGGTTVQCVCDDGYVDDGQGKCINPDNCPTGACAGGTCEDGLGDYSCKCGAGFTGTGTKACTAVMYCPQDACAPGGTCVDEMNWSCNCGTGFSGTGTRACTNVNDCPTDRCKAPGGTCKDGIGTYSCTCNPGFSGNDCQNDICNPNPCRNGGTCSRTGTMCTCAPGFSGKNCDIDACASNPCGAGGTCTRLSTGFSCTCSAGYLGTGTQRCTLGFKKVALSPHAAHACAIRSDDSVVCWGNNELKQLSPDERIHIATPFLQPNVRASKLAIGYTFACYVSPGGGTHCWGNNDLGQLGNGLSESNYVGTKVDTTFTANAVSANVSSACSILVDRTLICWGHNGQGELASGTYGEIVRSPRAVPNVTGVTSLVSGAHFACATREAAPPICWGGLGYGELGNGQQFGSLTPVEVLSPPSGKMTQLGAGGAFGCGLCDNGTVACWGSNGFGKLGNGNTQNSYSPVAVRNLSDATAIAAGDAHACALRATGQVVCWGANSRGQLGDGTIADSSSPVPVQNLSNVDQVACGKGFSCAHTRTGGLYCWGQNGWGELGNGQKDGTSAYSAVPVAVDAVP